MIFPKELKQKIKDFINSRTGLYFKDHNLKELEKAVIARTKVIGLDSIPSYYGHLISSEGNENEIRELLNLLTVQHTYFFRNEPHFKALKEKILPDIIKLKREKKDLQKGEKPSLRIWSAGCSTGEEPYSVAMVVKDLIEDLDAWDVEIYATDASTMALKQAREGIYGKSSLRMVDEEHLEKYFCGQTEKKGSDKLELDDTVKKMVRFGYLNLMEEAFPVGFDIIFCRNVVIYFNLENTIRVVNKFSESLDKNGYLFVGYSESLQFLSEKFQMKDWEGAIFYRKGRKEILPETLSLEEKIDEMSEELSIAELEAEEEKEKEKKKVVRHERVRKLLSESIKSLYLKEYDKVRYFAGQIQEINKDLVDSYYLFAEVYTSQGKFDMAKAELLQALKIDPLFAPVHYLFGSICVEEGDLENAKQKLKKTLYLDNDFVLAQLSLASVFKKEKKEEAAIRAYRNALKILSKSSLAGLIAYSGGFNAATLINICRSNIERLKNLER